MPYQLRLREHLARYKRDVLGVEEDGTWRHRGKGIPYPHILPAGKTQLNVLEGFRDEFWAYFEKQRREEPRPAKLHRDFSHLNSSQALAFNLFFPLLGSAHAEPAALLDALGCPPEPIARWRFEEVLNPREGTNFDVAITLASGRRVLVEVKLTESEFGTCADDNEHQRKLVDIYMDRLAIKVAPDALRAAAFFARYQILRNISYAGEGTIVIFLVPRGNEALADGAAFIADALLSPYREAVRVVYLEDLVARLITTLEGSPLAKDLAAIAAKYALA